MIMENYKLGDKYSKDFDYEGMLHIGVIMSIDDSIVDMNALHSSLVDVNYHTVAVHLWDSIKCMEKGHYINAARHMTLFNFACID